MNPLKMVPLAPLLALMSVTSAWADVAKLEFEKPFTLTSPSMSVAADRVELRLDKKANAWKENKVKRSIQRCAVKLSIEGRDLAVKNPILGEHYFGAMDLSCQAGNGGDAFQTRFSRVLFLGIRNCVESETMIDQDYCKLVVVATRKEADLSQASHDLIDDSSDKRVFIRVSSPGAEKNFAVLHLAPEGLNTGTLNSVQIFELSMGRTGSDFFVPGNNQLANFSGGVNYYLTRGAETAERDRSIGVKVDASLTYLEQSVHELQASARVTDALDSGLPGFMARYSATLKDLLSIVSPVEYFGREKRLKALEADVVQLSRAAHPDTVTDRDSFVRSYGAKYAEYLRVSSYFSEQGAPSIDYSKILAPVESASGIVAPSQLTSFATRGQGPTDRGMPGMQKMTAQIAGSTVNEIPAGTQITLTQDVVIMANSQATSLGNTPSGSACFVYVQPSSELRVIPAGTRLEVTGGQERRPFIAVRHDTIRGFGCDGTRGNDYSDLSIGDMVQAMKASTSFAFPLPKAI